MDKPLENAPSDPPLNDSPPPSEPAKKAGGKLLEVIESLGKAVLAATALTYVAGYLVVCLHSAQFGVSSLELVKPHYILAGLWLLFPLVSIGVMTTFAVAVMSSSRGLTPNKAPRSSWRLWLKRLAWGMFMCLSLLSIMIVALLMLLPRPRALPDIEQIVEYSSTVRELAGSFLWITGFAFFGHMFWRASHTAAHKDKEALRSIAVVFAVFLLFVSLEYLIWFSRKLYPIIPQSVGGGRPIVVRLIYPSISADRILPVAEARLSQPCLLLFEQSDSLVVRFPPQKGQVLRLRKTSM